VNFPRKILERVAFIFVFTLIFLGVYFSRTDLVYFEGTYVREDGLIEWLTVLALLIGVIMNVYRAQILRPFRRKRFILATYILSFVFLFGLGEEISWGQRIWEQIFDFHVPGFFRQYNSQGEMNFHNLQFSGTKINKLVFGTFLGICVVFYFLILPFLYRKIEKVKIFIDELALPIPQVYHIVAYIALAVLAEFIAGGKKGEILEFGGCWIVLLMIFEPYNRKIFSRKSFER
jgi:hypothetical protein